MRYGGALPPDVERVAQRAINGIRKTILPTMNDPTERADVRENLLRGYKVELRTILQTRFPNLPNAQIRQYTEEILDRMYTLLFPDLVETRPNTPKSKGGQKGGVFDPLTAGTTALLSYLVNKYGRKTLTKGANKARILRLHAKRGKLTPLEEDKKRIIEKYGALNEYTRNGTTSIINFIIDIKPGLKAQKLTESIINEHVPHIPEKIYTDNFKDSKKMRIELSDVLNELIDTVAYETIEENKREEEDERKSEEEFKEEIEQLSPSQQQAVIADTTLIRALSPRLQNIILDVRRRSMSPSSESPNSNSPENVNVRPKGNIQYDEETQALLGKSRENNPDKLPAKPEIVKPKRVKQKREKPISSPSSSSSSSSSSQRIEELQKLPEATGQFKSLSRIPSLKPLLEEPLIGRGQRGRGRYSKRY